MVSISWSVCAAPYASSAQNSISPKRWPPNCALPPSGCWVTSEYGPVLRAWILSSTRWSSFRMYMKPTVTFCSKASPVRPSNKRTFPDARRPSGRFVSTLNLTGWSGFCFVHSISASSTSTGVAPSNTGEATGLGPSPPFSLKTPWKAAHPRCVSRIWPMFIRDVHTHELVHARAEIVAGLARERLHVDDDAALAVRNLQRGVADLARLLLEDRADQLLLRGQLGLTLRRDLPDQQVARPDLGTDAHDAAVVEVAERLLTPVRNVARDLLVAELRGARVDLVLVDVDRAEDVLLDQPL